jgi:hypothetical protein
MTQFYIYPYVQASKSAKLLAEELDGKRILRVGSNYAPQTDHVVINWGASDCPFSQALNRDNKAALNKRLFFQRLEGLDLTPKFALSATAAAALTFPVFCRTVLEGRDGEGIVIAETAAQLPTAKLYVEGVDKTSEYRIHVGRHPVNGVIIIGSQKKVKTGVNTGLDSRIWCGDSTRLVWKVNGQPAFIPASVLTKAKKAFEKFPELTFGAFDVIFDNSSGNAYVIELNSAPMGTPETMRRYGDFFRSLAATTAVATPTPAPTPSPAPAPVQAAPVQAVPVSAPVPQPAPVIAPIEVQVAPTPAPQLASSMGLKALVKSQISSGHLSLDTVVLGYIQSIGG